MAPRRPPATADGDASSHQARLTGLRLLSSGELATKAFGERFGLSYAQSRRFITCGGSLRRPGLSPFFSSDEEDLLAKYIVVNASIGLGLSQDALSRVCASYLRELSPERQAAARAQFNGSLSPGRTLVTGFLSHHQGLRRYRVGTPVEGRARNSRPNVVARWYALLTLLYREHAITSAL